MSEPDLRTAAIAAEVYILLDAAAWYGLVEGGPKINVDRCEEVIAEAAAAGITYSADEVTEAIRHIVAWESASTAERARANGDEGPGECAT